MTAGTDLTPLIKSATALVATNKAVTLSDVLKALSPEQVSAKPPATVPLAREITPDQRKALERFPVVFGSVVPTERRALTEPEISSLLDERVTLDTVKKMAETRISDIATTVHNHLDVRAEQEGIAALLDDKGHYLVEGVTPVPGRADQFSREVREGSPTLSQAALVSLEEQGLITHEQYLSMTTQVRVVDEAKVFAAIKADPTLLAAIAQATEPGKKTSSMYVRKRK